MKRFKNILLSFAIVISFVVIVLMIVKLFEFKTSVYIEPTENIIIKYLSLKEEANSLQDGSCKDLILDYSNYIERGNFKGETKLNDLFDYLWNSSILDYYLKSFDMCNFSEDDLSDVTSLFLTNLSLPDTMFNKYIFSYEFSLKDSNRASLEPSLDNMSYLAFRANQVEILNKFVSLAKESEKRYED